MLKIVKLILFTALIISGSALAKDCTQAESTVDIVDCHAQRYESADKELNAVYSEAMRSLSDQEKNKLKDAQKLWLKYRDASIAFMIETNKDTGSYGNILISDYKAKLVEKRVLELKYILSGPEESKVDW